jgi:uncharacterized membrane protein YhaH (DUF805 family)
MAEKNLPGGDVSLGDRRPSQTLRILFGERTTGRLQRLPFLGFSIFASVIAALAMVIIALTMGGAAWLMSQDPLMARQYVHDHLTTPGFIAMLAIGLLLTFIHMNLSAKRLRDMGLQGWRTLGLFLLMGVGLAFFFKEATGLFQFLGFMVLAVTPSRIPQGAMSPSINRGV